LAHNILAQKAHKKKPRTERGFTNRLSLL